MPWIAGTEVRSAPEDQESVLVSLAAGADRRRGIFRDVTPHGLRAITGWNPALATSPRPRAIAALAGRQRRP